MNKKTIEACFIGCDKSKFFIQEIERNKKYKVFDYGFASIRLSYLTRAGSVDGSKRAKEKFYTIASK